MPRKKPQTKAEHIKDLKAADNALREIGELNRKLQAIDADKADRIDAIKADAKAQAEPVQERVKTLEAGLELFALIHKDELFADRKTRTLVFGEIGFRKSTKLKTLTKWTWEKVLGAIKDFGFLDAVRIKESVDKDALKQWPDDRLEMVGVVRHEADAFGYDTYDEPLGDVS